MNHRKTGRKLSAIRAPTGRRCFRNMVTSLLEHEQIRTTDAKAKELRGVAERMITLGKKGTLHARRQRPAHDPQQGSDGEGLRRVGGSRYQAIAPAATPA